MKKIAAIGLMAVAVLTFFPPVRGEEVPSWSGRTCLVAVEFYTSERPVRDLPEGVSEAVTSETTSIDLPRLACELLCVGSVAGFLIALRTEQQSRTDESAVDSSLA